MTVPEDRNSTPAGTAIPVGSWLALTVIVIGTAMVVLDSTIVNVALPEIGRSLKASTGVEWVVTVYLLAVSASLPATGWLADRFGRRSVFMWSMAVFTGASLGCALSPNFAALIAFRALQGVGGGAIPAVGMAILLEIFPRHQHGRAISTWGMAALLSPAFGPTFGGWLVTAFSWHWLFLINVPIGAFALIVSPRLLPDLAPREHHQLDLASVPLGAAALSLTVLALSNGSQWGWTSPRASGAGLTGLLLLGWFIRRNLRRTHPLLELGLLRNRAFSAAVTVTFTLQAVNFARLVFVPLELETVHHYSAFRVGLLLAPSAVVTAV
ncbi:MAG TPA: DHA2 family efflux MFS transporter permease subunit, partial [Acidimicrobiales bacterium]|nr:DHA2 family efflux MFS transporter permease subunit [Acidimicrobiales bacterium]